MKLKTLYQVAAVAGLASASAVAAERAVPQEVTVPLNGSYSTTSNNVMYDANGRPIAYDQTFGTPYGAPAGYAETGFTPPARFPVERIPVQYLRYYPARWYGLPGSTLPAVAPQVHMPTDTTQLGYYYQRVPTWMPVPGMIPGPPNPAHYHVFLPPVNAVPPETVSGERVISSRPVSEVSTSRTQLTPVPERMEAEPAPRTITPPPAPAPATESSDSKLPLQPPAPPASRS